MHVNSESPLLYFGTPVVLISTVNADGSYNLAPMSSAWWVGWRAILGLEASSKTSENLRRTGECVLNLPNAGQVAAVDAIARTTGSDPVPDGKVGRGYTTLREKFDRAGLTPVPSEIVSAPRAQECQVQMEATLTEERPWAADDQDFGGFISTFQVSIERLHLHESLIADGNPDRVDSDAWKPLIMMFSKFYGLADGQLAASKLAGIPEESYPRVGAQARSGGVTA